MTRKIWLVVAREYSQHVAKKSFWIGLLLVPLFFAGLFALQILSFTVSPEQQKKVAIVDRSHELGGALVAELSALKLKKSGAQEFLVEEVEAAADTAAQFGELNRRVSDKSLYGYLLVGEDVEAKGAFRFYTRNVGAETVMDKIEDAIEKSLIGFRLGKQNVSLTSEQLQKIIRRARLDSFKVDPEGKTSRRDFGGVYVASIVFAMILLMTIITFGVTALRGILEEKSSRIIEVLLSSMTPFELLAGKVVGVCLVGLTQILAYVVTGAALALYTSGSTGFANDVMSAFTPSVVGFFLVYYLLGVFLFLSMFVAVGSMVNTEQEAQHFQQPIIWALVIPIYATFFFINNPDSLIARLASFIPFFTPMVMLMRISVLTPPWWEIGLSIAIMAVTTVGVVWVVSRIFRVGILMYGKRPNVPEIVRWVRTG